MAAGHFDICEMSMVLQPGTLIIIIVLEKFETDLRMYIEVMRRLTRVYTYFATITKMLKQSIIHRINKLGI